LGLQQFLTQLILLEQVPKVQQRRGVGDLLDREVQSKEPAHRMRVVDRVLDALVRQREPRLQQVHQQHRLKRLRLPAPMARVVERLDQPDPPRPRDRGIHRVEELLTEGTRRRFAYSTSVKLIWSLGMTNSPRSDPYRPGKTPLKRTRKSALP
jgi:hypothetical protein